ncbi:hypothetical protein M407DRAFT_3942 [Tulasnella calospora MUT 4182]|uniref:WSC domain-containing protein n=1 Tax=Tulasnella calospora MUT 4182 TaxID=1051891 RepID=A0A0C3QXB0_9AGAM|nr:hypothetical protein M407DRAFT_3942 [Tulasnella calospora MUT 4182]
MKLSLAAVALSAITAATAAPASEIDKRTCYTSWSYLECSYTGTGGGISASGFTLGGGSSGSWCTSYCTTNGPYTYAAITNGNYCSCSNTLGAGAAPVSAAGSCYSVCYGSSKTTQQCLDGSCKCGGPRAYSIYQSTQVCS